MKHLAWLLLLLPLVLRAQVYENSEYGFSLRYAPEVWKPTAIPAKSSVLELDAGRKGTAEAKIVVQAILVPASERNWSPTELREQLLLALEKAWGQAHYQLLSAEPWAVETYQGNLLDYYFKLPLGARTRVQVLLVRRGSLYYRISYTCKEDADARFGAPATSVLTSLAFQASANPLLAAPTATSSPTPTVEPAAAATGSSVFGDTKVATTGLAGNVYILPGTTTRLPAFDDLTPVGTIYTQRIDIPARTWEEGFPGVTNQFEWFGIVYTGNIRPKTRGLYTFRLVSDDGARLFIDGRLVIDNDGIHPPSSATGQLLLDASEHTIRLQYFQGPRYMIALQLFARLQDEEEAVFPGSLFTVRPPAPPAPPVAAPQAVWRGRILDESTRSPLPQAQLRPAAEPAVAVDATAAFAWRGIPGRTYGYEVRQAGYYVAHGSWTAGATDQQQDILLRKISIGSTMLLEKVQFQQGKTVMLPGADTALRSLLTLLNEHPAMTIELAGHTDNVGPADKNLQLSEDRVAAVKAYLVRQGIAANRIVGRGYGGTRPRASNDQEVTRQLNRRVEFTITGLE